jgi:hypothetical protein
MVQARASIVIHCPVQALYGLIADDFARNCKCWSFEVQRLDILTPGPLRVGSRARQVRVDQGRRSETTFRVSRLEPPRRVCFVESRDQFRIEYVLDSMDAEGKPGTTKLRFSFQLPRLELYMRPFEKLIRVAVQDGAMRTVSSIKRLVEAEAPTGEARQASTS